MILIKKPEKDTSNSTNHRLIAHCKWMKWWMYASYVCRREKRYDSTKVEFFDVEKVYKSLYQMRYRGFPFLSACKCIDCGSPKSSLTTSCHSVYRVGQLIIESTNVISYDTFFIDGKTLQRTQWDDQTRSRGRRRLLDGGGWTWAEDLMTNEYSMIKTCLDVLIKHFELKLQSSVPKVRQEKTNVSEKLQV